MPKLSRRSLFVIIPVAAIVLASAGFAAKMMEGPPAGLDMAMSKRTDHGTYVTSLAADVSPIPVGSIHTWTVKVMTPDGQPANGIVIAIGGGMPQHGHGLPTKPEVTTDLGGGGHLVEGMKFNMPGWWTLTVSIDGPKGADKATFNVVL
jgi:hypothetical protein